MTGGLRVMKVTARTKGGGIVDTFLGTFFALAFVIGTLVLVAWALFEMSPFARHGDQFRDPRTGKRRGKSPRLD
jgi:hypothetical protein